MVVEKRRTVYFAGRTRLHLDQVVGLGDFLELEVVLREGEDQGAGELEATALIQALGLAPSDLIESGYADLLEAAGGAACTSST